MNQHSKRNGQANGNSLDEVRRGATRAAVVVAIVLCVGFAVSMVAISSCGKPQSQQEMQTQPEAAVQTETPTLESVETEIPEPEAVQTETPKPEASRLLATGRDVPPESSTATPVSQANPAAPAPVEEDPSYTLSHDLNQETVTFEAVNPKTQVPGQMTVTISGAYRGKRLGDEQSSAGSHFKASQQATFSFVPYDRYSPSYSATVNTLQLAGNSSDDSISFNFGLDTTGSDGSSQRFVLKEVVTITKDGAKVTFQQLN